MKPITYGFVKNGSVTTQIVHPGGGAPPENPPDGVWLPIIMELQPYDSQTHREIGRTDRIDPDRIVRTNVLEEIPITADMVRAECQRRIIIACGARDLIDALIKQINGDDPSLKSVIDALRAKSNLLEGTAPSDFRDNKYWT